MHAGLNQSYIQLSGERVGVETKPLMIPSKKNRLMVSLHANSWEVLIFPSCQAYSAAPNPFQSPPISFQLRKCCQSPSSHLPVSGFVPSKHGDRKCGGGGGGVGGSASKEVTDNSVFGSYRGEGLADLPKVKASWSWLGSGRTPRER